MKKSFRRLFDFVETKVGFGGLLPLLLILSAFFLLTIPILPHIPPHADESQFYSNAWSIIAGRQLTNYLHIALTEYSLAIFFLFLSLFNRSILKPVLGTLDAQTLLYGHSFGLILYLVTFVLVVLLLQGGEKKIRGASVFFAALFFGSVGMFERFMRINSDSMSIFVTLYYLLFSLLLYRRKASRAVFFVGDLVFIFLSSFTNLKSLYLTLPILFLNLLFTFHFRTGEGFSEEKFFKKIYDLILYLSGIFFGSVLFWIILIPKPVDPKLFWYNIKNATVRGVGFDFEYPTQSGRSWFVYLYDFFAEYLSLAELLAVAIFLLTAFLFVGREPIGRFYQRIRGKLGWSWLKEGGFYFEPGLIMALVLASYYFGVSRIPIHWSRWGAPLGVFGLIFVSLLLEKAFLNLWGKIKKKGLLLAGTFLLLLFSWSLRIGLFIDLKNSQFPVRGGYSLTYQDIDNFLKEKSIATSDAQRKVAWFTGYTNNVGNLSFEKVVEKDYKDVKYILWPYWNIGPLYSTAEVDTEAHNQRYFVKNYASEVTFRFPTLISRYMHAMKYFAWHYLRATWNPEMDSMIEPQYGLVTLKGQPTELILNYLVGAEGISRYFSPYSLTFNFRNLPDTYIFPPCASHPDVKRVVDGSEVDILPPLAHNGIGGKTAGLYCHSLWFRVFPRGVYYIRFEGLPPDFDNSQKVYSNLQFQYDPGTRTIVTGLAETRITAEFGVATKEADLPNLKFRVFYQSLPFKDSAKVKK